MCCLPFFGFHKMFIKCLSSFFGSHSLGFALHALGGVGVRSFHPWPIFLGGGRGNKTHQNIRIYPDIIPGYPSTVLTPHCRGSRGTARGGRGAHLNIATPPLFRGGVFRSSSRSTNMARWTPRWLTLNSFGQLHARGKGRICGLGGFQSRPP